MKSMDATPHLYAHDTEHPDAATPSSLDSFVTTEASESGESALRSSPLLDEFLQSLHGDNDDDGEATSSLLKYDSAEAWEEWQKNIGPLFDSSEQEEKQTTRTLPAPPSSAAADVRESESDDDDDDDEEAFTAKRARTATAEFPAGLFSPM